MDNNNGGTLLMVCKECGSYNSEHLSICKVCGALLNGERTDQLTRNGTLNYSTKKDVYTRTLSSDKSDSRPIYDVFISHASEDKVSLVRPLAFALKARGLSVWYDEFELKIGDSIVEKIDAGLARSNFGIVIISKNFICKRWTKYEYAGLIAKKIAKEQRILPVWHNVTMKDVIDFSPSLADTVAGNTTLNTVDEIAEKITQVVLSGKHR